MVIHGDPGHSCYDKDVRVTCFVAQMALLYGPRWQELAWQRVLDQHGEVLDRFTEM